MSRVLAFDGLRGAAVLMVLAFHAVPAWLPGGFIGVDVFFVLSGFLITTQLLDAPPTRFSAYMRWFLVRRFARLLPALLVMLGGCLLFACASQGQLALVEASKNAWLALSATSNLARMSDISAGGDFGHTWSLSLEWQFYLIWPLCVWALRALRVPPLLAFGLVVVLTLVVFAWRVYLVGHQFDVARIYNGFDTRCDLLLMGAALAAVMHSGTDWLRATANSAWHDVYFYAVAIGVVGLLLNLDWDSKVYYLAVLPVLGLAVVGVLCQLLIANTLTARVFNNSLLVGLGTVSYGIYLWHFPINRVLIQYGLQGAPLLGSVLILSVILAFISFRYIERPLRQWVGARDLA